MIGKIQSLTGIGRYRDFVWHESVPAFSRVNLVFGYNGSGKTTISNVLRLFSVQDSSRADELLDEMASQPDPKAVVEIEGKVEQYSATGRKLDLYAFNSDFVAEHVYDGGHLTCKAFDSSVVTSEQLQNPVIRDLEDQIQSAQGRQGRIQTRIDSMNNEFESIKRSLSQELNDRIKGSRSPTMSIPTAPPGRSASDIRRDLTEAYLSHERCQKQEQLEEDLEWLTNASLQRLEHDPTHLMHVLTQDIASESLAFIEARVQSLHSDSLRHSTAVEWLEDGSRLLEAERGNEHPLCPLCQSDLQERIGDLMRSYSAFASQSYDELAQEIDRIIEEAGRDRTRISSSRDVARQLRTLSTRYAEADEASPEILPPNLSGLLTLLEAAVDMAEKKRVDIGRTEWGFDVAELRKELDEANAWVTELESRQSRLQATLEHIVVDPEAALRRIKDLMQESATAQFDESRDGSSVEERARLLSESEETGREIKDLEAKRMREVARLKDESRYVNGFLRKLGTDHFDVVISSSDSSENVRIQYVSGSTKRSLRHSLSESEKTALAFAYFLSKIQYEVADNPHADMSDVVIVIDDPVSSLDENRLHSTACLIEDMFSKAGQLFVLSHNVVFMRFLSNIIGNPREETDGEKASCRRDYYISDLTGCLEQLPSTLWNYKSTYFQKLQALVEYRDGEISYEDAKRHLPNYVRTVLESFLSFKFFVLAKGSSNDKYLAPGLRKLAGVLQSRTHLLAGLQPVEDVTASTLISKLDRIREITDPQSHGSVQDVEHIDFISECELKSLVADAINVIQFLDGIHLEAITQA